MSDVVDVESIRFWRKRLDYAERENEPHKAIWDTDSESWRRMTKAHQTVLARLVVGTKERPVRVLDCGCGLGHLSEILPDHCRYTGVDISRDFILHAKERYPSRADQFRVANLRSLPFEDGEFDVGVVRGVEGMIVNSLGDRVWRVMEEEILRVCGRAILLNYSQPDVARVVEGSHPRPESGGVLDHQFGRLQYRVGQNMTVEIFDIFVHEDHRRRGVGRELVNRLSGMACWSMFAFTRVNNLSAVKFYEALGFRKTLVSDLYPGMAGWILVWTNPKGITNVNALL